MRALALSSLLCVGAVLSIVPMAVDPAHALDLTGRWKMALPSESYSDVVQTGNQLAISNLTGTISGGILFTVGGQLTTPIPGGCQGQVGGRVVGETRVAGTLIAQCPFLGDLLFQPFGGIRCECDDGNNLSGDGCSGLCQIEPCFSCTGTPSVCTPSPDGAACDDRSACTVGETCSAGVCGGGSAVPSCLDVSGQWLEHVTSSEFPIDYYRIADIAQIGTMLELDQGPGIPAAVGTIDPMTGAMTHVVGGLGAVQCPEATEVSHGTVAPDGGSYTLVRGLPLYGPTGCHGYEVDVTATRCDGPCVLPTTTTSTSVPTSTSTSTTTSTSTSTTTLPLVLAGKRLTMKDHSDPARRALTVDAKDAGVGIGAGNGSGDDPTQHGATLRVRTAAGCAGPCDATYVLPAVGWKRIGVSGQDKGYRYSDKMLAAGPVKQVSVSTGKRVKISAKGAALAPLATDPSPVDVTLTLGSSRSCVAFGGTMRFIPGRSLIAVDAPAPASCP